MDTGEPSMAYRIGCTQDDDFVIQSEDEQEVISHIKEHAREKHDMDVSDDQAREMMSET